ncbi:MAG TPA: DUF5597 domain-containing protein [Terriglobales bacterium]|nr:DUF5597 domain-containing protein [Terriglobales bacterium]
MFGARGIEITFTLKKSVLLLGIAAVICSTAAAEQPPTISFTSGTGQLIVRGKPFLVLGGELANSSAGTAAQADTILPKLAQMHINTVLMPVAWEQIEPAEGHFDFSILDRWTEVARKQNLHLVILWFGSWKNAFSEYAPDWVKSDTARFPRAISAEGLPTEILSTFGGETVRSDARAFGALMRHIREIDAEQQTVVMVQVENEIGFLGRGGRDRSAAANRAFQGTVPSELTRGLEQHRLQLSPELAESFKSGGHTWSEVFGANADEVFMAWHYAVFVNKVAQAGKKEYALPMYLNAQLPAPLERAGEYPSGGPHPYYQEVYRIGAPSIDFYSPDIYWPNFDYWVQRYQSARNPVFVPEARLDSAPYNALYAYGQARAFGFSPFGVDSESRASKQSDAKPELSDFYAVLADLSDVILDKQEHDQCRGLVVHANSSRPTQTVALGGYLFEATLSRSWPAKSLLTDDGAVMVLEMKPDEFYLVGAGLTVSVFRDPDTDDRTAGIASIEQISKANGQWVVDRRLNGDESNQGRQLLMDARTIHVYRVKLYTYSDVRSH